MEFEAAAQRLAKEQKNYRGRKEVVVSQKAKREVDYRRKQQALLKEERERQARIAQYQHQYITNCDRGLKVKRLASQLQATSIWGEGDKIALPPSLLETLTAADDTNLGNGNPWIFRIGILNPEYNYPSSILLQTLKPPKEEDSDESDMDDDDDDNDKAAYLDELAYKYISYTHCTVVEFTQEEGHVGIPQPIAAALLDPARRRKEDSLLELSTTRTVDPAAKSNNGDDATDNNNNNNMDEENTPGHLAWGAFDIPSLPLEISLVQLPKGRGCTLVPTKEAVQNNFYGLQDVKLVLEQSLIRTRATLALGDTVQTWHRGTKFDLKVTNVTPSTFHAVTCINTDIEVDIGEVEGSSPEPASTNVPAQQQGNVLGGGGGHTLASSSRSSTPMTTSTPSSIPLQQHTSNAPIVLLPEPPQGQTEGICTVQIRSSGGTGRRRFHVHQAKLQDVFDFAASIAKTKVGTFQLVSRFPRRVFTIDNSDTSSSAVSTLAMAGIQTGQELLMVEPL
jgi:hypothetical protein